MRNQETASQQRKATTAPAIRRCAWRTAGAVRRLGQRALRSPTQQRYWHVLHLPCLEPPEQETMPASEETDASASGSAERVAVALRRRAEGRRAGGAQAPGRQPLPGHLPGTVLTAEDRRPRTPCSDRRPEAANGGDRAARGVDGGSSPDQGWTAFHLPSAPGGRCSRWIGNERRDPTGGRRAAASYGLQGPVSSPVITVGRV